MKKIFYGTGAFLLALCALNSCSNSGGGNSIPVDSTNATGAAPVDYSADNPGSPADYSNTARDQYNRDTLGDRAGQTEPVGNGTNTSNTSDARTTPGSANNGDADGDRKR
jgi:hypothetical protein